MYENIFSEILVEFWQVSTKIQELELYKPIFLGRRLYMNLNQNKTDNIKNDAFKFRNYM